jgi:hypothetical protein
MQKLWDACTQEKNLLLQQHMRKKNQRNLGDLEMTKLDEIQDIETVETDEAVIFHHSNDEDTWTTRKKLRGYGKVIEKEHIGGQQHTFWLPLVMEDETGLVTANQIESTRKSVEFYELEDEQEE